MEILQQSQCIVGSHFIWYSYTAIVSLTPGFYENLLKYELFVKNKTPFRTEKKNLPKQGHGHTKHNTFYDFSPCFTIFQNYDSSVKKYVRGQLWSQKKALEQQKNNG